MHNRSCNDTRCDGISRRDMLRVGGLMGLGVSMFSPLSSSLLASQAAGARAKSCILLWLDGGPSHLETFDPKPAAPSEVRGPFGTISTNVPGVKICELMPRTAQVVDRLSIIRSMTSPLGEHGLANHYLLTGYQPSPALEYPSYGAVVAHERGRPATLPPYVSVPDFRSIAGAGFLGRSYQPFATGGDPAKADFRVRDLDFYPGVTDERMERRRAFLAQLEWFQQAAAGLPPTDPQFEQAYRLVTSPEAKRAFDLSQEPAAVRAEYGPRTFGQSCLLARRLVERGVPFVTVQFTGWDTHDNLVLRLKEGYTGAQVGVGLIPTFDQAFAALIRDLADRGLLEDTLVVAMGEFGRTPKLNTQGGRDHWPRVFSVVLAGGSVPGGQVIGSSDRTGEGVADRPVTPSDLARTIYTLLGVDPDRELWTSDGRPVRINQDGEVIRELSA
jgi:hypothetical protein